MKRSILVGNGFLFHLEHLVRNYGYDSNLIDEIKDAQNLFGKFIEIENDLKKILQTDNSIENILSRLDDLFYWYHKSVSIPISSDCYNELNQRIKEIIDDKIVPIVRSFENHEKQGTYGKIWKEVEEYSIGESIEKSTDEIGVFTTNYDGYIDQILRKSSPSTDESGFVFKDGFAGNKSHPLRLFDLNLKSKKIIHHIHSSYKFGWSDGEVIKVRSGEHNSDPHVLFSDSNKKLIHIRMNYVLSTYWENFIYWINSSEELVIYGNSLQSDPHIVDVIIRYSTKIKTIYVIEKDLNGFDKVKSRLKEVENKLSFINSNDIGWSDFIDIFNNPSSLKQSLPF